MINCVCMIEPPSSLQYTVSTEQYLHSSLFNTSHSCNMTDETTVVRQWSTEVPHTTTSDRTCIFRSPDTLEIPKLGSDGCRTLYEVLRRGHQINPLGPCLGFRAISTTGFATPYIYSNYNEVIARVDAIAAGLDTLKLVERNEDGLLLLGIYLKNCMEWILAEHAIYALGGCTVPFYDTLGPDTVSFILNQTNLSTCVLARSELVHLCKAKKTGLCPSLKVVLLVDGTTPSAMALCRDAGIETCTSLARVESYGGHVISTLQHEGGHKHSPPSGEDIATFCYTSGTTGDPKGALITHTNFLSSMAGMIDSVFKPIRTDRHLSYLPLAHIFERVIMAQVLMAGGSVAFYRGDPTQLIDDIKACRPTLLPAVPRVLNRIYDKIMAGIASAGGIKKRLFEAALKAKMDGLKNGHLTHAIYDRLLFHKIKQALGMDCLRFMASGSAPLSESVMFFFRCMLGIPVVEGYGQTEGTASATVSRMGDIATAGHVGSPTSCTEIVLVDVPEMGYFHTDNTHRGKPCRGRGEIWVRGPNIFKGYYREPEKTKETVDEQGWLHSGDIGLITPEGNLQIIDRKKNIFKLAQGEYVAVEKIENLLTQSLLIAQCFVYGDSYQSYLIAIIVPDEEVVMKWSKDSANPSISGLSFQALCKSKTLHDKIMNEVTEISNQNQLYGFEIPKAIYLEPLPFSVENNLLTPTFKLKRQQLKDYYAIEIDSMYANSSVFNSKL